jgi:hypothetical protein
VSERAAVVVDDPKSSLATGGRRKILQVEIGIAAGKEPAMGTLQVYDVIPAVRLDPEAFPFARAGSVG